MLAVFTFVCVSVHQHIGQCKLCMVLRGVCTLETASYSIGRLSAGLKRAWLLSHCRDDWTVRDMIILTNRSTVVQSVMHPCKLCHFGPKSLCDEILQWPAAPHAALPKTWFVMQEAEASSSAHAANKAAQHRHIVQLQASLLHLMSWHDCR
jgi:hypothetical protein